MPRIINAYASGNDSIADSLKSLGDSMFANQAQKELIRQEGLKAARQNSAATAASEAYRNNNAIELGANDILSNPDSTAMGAQALARGSLVPGATPASLGTLQIGAGHPIEATVQGQNAQLGNARTIAGMDIAGAQHRQDTMPYVTTDSGGNATVSTNSGAIGTTPVPSSDHIIAMEVARQLKAERDAQAAPAAPPPNVTPVMPSSPSNAPGVATPPPAAASSPVPAAQPAAPAPAVNAPMPPQAPLPGLLPNHPGVPHPLVQKAMGMPPGGTIFMNPATGQVGLSYDGGRSVQDASSGSWYTGAGNGFLPVDSKDAVAQTRANTSVANIPPTPPTNATGSQAASDVAATTGIAPAVQEHVNATLGAIPGGPAVIQAATGSPQIGGPTEAARSRQELLANELRTTIMGLPGRPTTYAQKLVQELVPQDRAWGNPATEAQHIQQIVNQLRQDREYAAQMARDPATPPETRVQFAQHIGAIDKNLRQLTAAPAATSAPAAPTQAPQTATNPQTGQKLQLVNGQWVPVQ